MDIRDVRTGPYTNDVFTLEAQHYVTLFAVSNSATGEPALLEPTKCTQWRWCRWTELPVPLFAPLITLRSTGFVPDGAL